MKIAILCYGLSGLGGTETVLKSWFSFFEHNNIGFKVIVFNHLDNTDFIEGKNYELIEKNTSFKLRLSLAKDFIKNQYDIVICFTPKYARYAQFARMFCFRKKPKIVFLSHFTFRGPSIIGKNMLREKDKKELDNCDAIFALCESMVKEYVNFGVSAENIHLIFNPIKNPNYYIPHSKDRNKFVFIGRLDDNHKDIKGIIDVFASIERPFHLDIIGSGSDEESLLSYINEKGEVFRQKVTLTGKWMVDPWKSIKEVDALILNSRYEGFGMVLAEAMARGVPCISTDCYVGPSDIIKHGVNGYLFEPGDQKSFKSSIYKIMDGELKSSQDQISATVEHMYEKAYYKRFNELLNMLCSSNK